MKTTQILLCTYLFLITIPVQPVKAQCRGAFCDSRCPTENAAVMGRTATHKIVICSEIDGKPTHYIGVNIITGSSLFIPVTSYDGDGKYVARNGKFTYTLIVNGENSQLIIKSPRKKSKIESFIPDQS
jgi:hypothetical protein